MKTRRSDTICNSFFFRMILTTFLFCPFAGNAQNDNSKEERLHKIYVNNYSRPILDSDWFKIISAIEDQAYTVKAGDTLWGICKIYFGDGNYWSKLWSVNKEITNPHLIFIGDTIHFGTGSFIKPPTISVDKNSESGVDATGAPVMAEQTTEAPATMAQASSSRPYTALPSYFKESPEIKLSQEQPVTVLERPAQKYNNNFFLTQEVLSTRPEIIGYVKTVGQYRMATGESNILLVTGQHTEGTTLSVLSAQIDEIKGGHIVKVLAIVKVSKILEDNLAEARVVDQFDGLVVDSLVTAYVPPVVAMTTGTTVQESAIQILNNDKAIWSTGDLIFLKTESALNPGDVLNMNNKFDSKTDFFTHNGLVKIVSSQAPYATGLVVYTQMPLEEDSVSQPVKSDSWF